MSRTPSSGKFRHQTSASPACRSERLKTIFLSKHILNHAESEPLRFKSRRQQSSCHTAALLTSQERLIKLWKECVEEQPHICDARVELKEILPLGQRLPWKHWRCLNRLWTRVARTKSTLLKWGLLQGTALCKCGTAADTAAHVLKRPLLPQERSLADLCVYNDVARDCVVFWKDAIWQHTLIIIAQKQQPCTCFTKLSALVSGVLDILGLVPNFQL